MNSIEMKKLLNIRAHYNEPTWITLKGWSMNPLLYNNDVLQILPAKTYQVGDIVVFFYLNIEILVQHIICIKNACYICKGDNSFRLEEVTPDQICGKIIAVERDNRIVEFSPPKNVNHRLCFLSFRIRKNYLQSNMNINWVKTTWSYKIFFTLINNSKNLLLNRSSIRGTEDF